MSKIPAILKELENESIEILRETASGFKKPVMMYSIGKDSSVLLHLARKAFFPSPIPFPLLHVDTTWKFREMISFRDRIVADTKSQLIVHTNQEGVEANINPFNTNASEYTRVMKTVALRQALDMHGFDAALVDKVVGLVDRAEYKRRQYPPGTKISNRAFGKDRRLPITSHWNES